MKINTASFLIMVPLVLFVSFVSTAGFAEQSKHAQPYIDKGNGGSGGGSGGSR